MFRGKKNQLNYETLPMVSAMFFFHRSLVIFKILEIFNFYIIQVYLYLQVV